MFICYDISQVILKRFHPRDQKLNQYLVRVKE